MISKRNGNEFCEWGWDFDDNVTEDPFFLWSDAALLGNQFPIFRRKIMPFIEIIHISWMPFEVLRVISLWHILILFTNLRRSLSVAQSLYRLRQYDYRNSTTAVLFPVQTLSLPCSIWPCSPVGFLSIANWRQLSGGKAVAVVKQNTRFHLVKRLRIFVLVPTIFNTSLWRYNYFFISLFSEEEKTVVCNTKILRNSWSLKANWHQSTSFYCFILLH
jgi:hypothetical protein